VADSQPAWPPAASLLIISAILSDDADRDNIGPARELFICFLWLLLLVLFLYNNSRITDSLIEASWLHAARWHTQQTNKKKKKDSKTTATSQQ
jgi:hypothetical protein